MRHWWMATVAANRRRARSLPGIDELEDRARPRPGRFRCGVGQRRCVLGDAAAAAAPDGEPGTPSFSRRRRSAGGDRRAGAGDAALRPPAVRGLRAARSDVAGRRFPRRPRRRRTGAGGPGGAAGVAGQRRESATSRSSRRGAISRRSMELANAQPRLGLGRRRVARLGGRPLARPAGDGPSRTRRAARRRARPRHLAARRFVLDGAGAIRVHRRLDAARRAPTASIAARRRCWCPRSTVSRAGWAGVRHRARPPPGSSFRRGSAPIPI